MKLFKKLDDYLLHYYPTIWITRIHSFLPIGLGIALILFFTTLAVKWNPKDDFPSNEVAIVLMIVPVLIYLVYWFVFQSRYNVAKSGGRMPLSFEYLNFFSYMLVFLMGFLIISAIPIGNYQRIHNAIDEEQLRDDIKKLNAGNALMFNTSLTFNEDGTISYYPSDFVYMYYYEYDYSYETISDYGSVGEQRINHNQARQLISDFIKAYNKYAEIPITQTSAEILADYEQTYSGYDYIEPVYVENSWDVQYKLIQLTTLMEHGRYGEYSQPWFWKIILAVIAMLSMVVWMFKQMKLRQFVFGFIAVCLTPLMVAIVGVILFELIGIRHEEEVIVSAITLLFYLFFAAVTVRAFLSSTLHNTGYIITMYLQFFLPLLPLFLWLFFADHNYLGYYNNFESTANFLYWSGWFMGITSIAAFKPLYAKFRSLPSKN